MPPSSKLDKHMDLAMTHALYDRLVKRGSRDQEPATVVARRGLRESLDRWDADDAKPVFTNVHTTGGNVESGR